MTKAKMNWKHMTLELDGHAGSAPYGKDIVCAAISILTQSLVNALADLQVQYNMAGIDWSGSAEEGTLKIRARVCWANLSLVRGTGNKVIYANAYTIWNILAAIHDDAGNKAFIPSPMSDPVTKGVVYGYTVKEDNNLADKVMYAGAPAAILANNFEDLFINRAMDPKTFEDIIAGYSLFDAGIENPLSFVKVTFANPS